MMIYFGILQLLISTTICSDKFTTGIVKANDSDEADEVVYTVELKTVDIWCNTTDTLRSMVSWYIVAANGQRTDLGIQGNLLRIKNITRDCSDDLYECVITRGDEHVAKRIKVITEYRPFVDILVSLNSQDGDTHDTSEHNDLGTEKTFILYQSLGDTVTLLCDIESFPYGNTTWYFNNTWIVRHVAKAEPETNIQHILNWVFVGIEHPSYVAVNDKTSKLKLHFKLSDGKEFGEYRCCSRNKYGKDCWTIELQKKGQRLT